MVMQKFAKRFLIVSLFSLMLGGCKTEFSVDAFVSDTFADENLDTPAVMLVEIPTCEQQSEYESKILALFDSGSAAKISGCEEKGMNSMMAVSLNAEMSSVESNKDLILFRHQVDNMEIDGINYEVRGLKPVISKEFLTRVDSLMQENFQTLSYEDIAFEILINNDEKGDILVTAYQLWVDGEPFESFRRQPLSRRGTYKLKFSNLVSDLILNHQMPIVAYIYRPL